MPPVQFKPSPEKLAIFHARLELTPTLSIVIYRRFGRIRASVGPRGKVMFPVPSCGNETTFNYPLVRGKRMRIRHWIRNQYSRRCSWLTLRFRRSEKRAARYRCDLQSYAITGSSGSWWSRWNGGIWFTISGYLPDKQGLGVPTCEVSTTDSAYYFRPFYSVLSRDNGAEGKSTIFRSRKIAENRTDRS